MGSGAATLAWLVNCASVKKQIFNQWQFVNFKSLENKNATPK